MDLVQQNMDHPRLSLRHIGTLYLLTSFAEIFERKDVEIVYRSRKVALTGRIEVGGQPTSSRAHSSEFSNEFEEVVSAATKGKYQSSVSKQSYLRYGLSWLNPFDYWSWARQCWTVQAEMWLPLTCREFWPEGDGQVVLRNG